MEDEEEEEDLDLATFRELPRDTPPEELIIPETHDNRKVTNKGAIRFYVAICICLLPFLAYCVYFGDLSRVLRGYDQCGNVCGKKNSKYSNWNCTGKDYSQSPFTQIQCPFTRRAQYEHYPRKCVPHCTNGLVHFMYKCFVRSSSKELVEDKLEIEEPSFIRTIQDEEDGGDGGDAGDGGGGGGGGNGEGGGGGGGGGNQNTDKDMGENEYDVINVEVVSIFLTFVLSIVLTLMFVFLINAATTGGVWSLLLFAGIMIVAMIWFLFLLLKRNFILTGTYTTMTLSFVTLVLGLILTVAWLIYLFVLVQLFRKIELIIHLMRTAIDILNDMNLLLFIPIYVAMGQLAMFTLYGVFTAYIYTAGILTKGDEGFLYYRSNGVMKFTFFYNSLVYLWCLLFVLGFQYMIISLTIIKWYWSKSKELRSPIYNSMCIVLRFHLGSIAYGSTVNFFFAILRALFMFVRKEKSEALYWCPCVMPIKYFLTAVSKYAYIEIGLNAQGFYKSGRRAASIIFKNNVDIIALNYISDFILLMGQIMIASTVFLIIVMYRDSSEPKIEYPLIYITVAFLSFLIPLSFFAAFEAVIDTLLFCYSEDKYIHREKKNFIMTKKVEEFEKQYKIIHSKKMGKK